MPRKAKKTDDQPLEAIAAEAVAETLASAPPDVAEVPDAPDTPDVPDDASTPAGAETLRQAVTFLLEGQLYGLPIEAVQEIQQLVEFTPVPDKAPALLGLIDLRGIVVPAIDLRLLLGLAASPLDLDTPMVFCRVRGHLVCLVVDAVEDVVDLPPDGLQPPSSLYSLADRMLGMCRLPQGLLLLLDVERLVPEAAFAAADRAGGAR